MKVLLAISGVGIVVFVHELGHYLGARLGGMKVRQLALGFGPRLLGARRGGTEYRINAVPLGGYVLVAGYQDGESGTGWDDPSLMQNRPAWARAIYYAAGPLFNLLLAAGLIGAAVFLQGIPAGREVRIEAVEPASPAERAGLRRDDILVAVNGRRVTDAAAVRAGISEGGGIVVLDVLRDGRALTLAAPPEGGRIGVSLMERVTYSRAGLTPSGALAHTVSTFERMAASVAVTVGRLFSGRASISEFSGPVSMISSTADAASFGWANFLMALAFIGINLGLLNLLPLPALDGGRLLLLALEKAFGLQLSLNKQAVIHLAGFAALMFLLGWITILDIMRLGG